MTEHGQQSGMTEHGEPSSMVEREQPSEMTGTSAQATATSRYFIISADEKGVLSLNFRFEKFAKPPKRILSDDSGPPPVAFWTQNDVGESYLFDAKALKAGIDSVRSWLASSGIKCIDDEEVVEGVPVTSVRVATELKRLLTTITCKRTLTPAPWALKRQVLKRFQEEIVDPILSVKEFEFSDDDDEILRLLKGLNTGSLPTDVDYARKVARMRSETTNYLISVRKAELLETVKKVINSIPENFGSIPKQTQPLLQTGNTVSVPDLEDPSVEIKIASQKAQVIAARKALVKRIERDMIRPIKTQQRGQRASLKRLTRNTVLLNVSYDEVADLERFTSKVADSIERASQPASFH